MQSPPAPKDIEVFWQNHVVSPDTIDLVITVPTFKRPDHLKITLESLTDQTTKLNYAIVVMDNHPEGSEGATAAQEVLQSAGISATVILAHRRGNCAAYNAGFHTALETYPYANWVQIIDDDEITHSNWLADQLMIAEETEADFVGAPQIPVFEVGANLKFANHPVFQPPYETSGAVPILYSSGNVLISTSLLKEHGHPWLDEQFNFLGGGDSDFYSRCKSTGATFAWCKEAAVNETTPARRTEFSWLNARSLRNGSISALIQLKAARKTTDHLKRIVKTCLLLAASPYRSLILFVNSRSLTMALNPMNVALGRVLMEFGFANEQYRAADKN